MDFSKYGLDDEVVKTIEKDYEADIAGLKAKNSDLIDREKKLKETNEALTLEMSTKEEDAKVALAEKEGTVEQYKNAVAERDQKIETIQREFKETENARILDGAVNEFSTVIADNPAAKLYMQKQFKDSVEVVDGVLKPKDATMDIEKLKQSLVSDEANAQYIKAPVGSGGGPLGGRNGFNQVEPTKKVTSTTSSYLATTQ